MITPSFGITATERVLPKLALDFTTASLDSRITFTRTTGASNPATYVNSSGYVTAATNNQPRFDYDPATLVCKGLLIEESRTNIALQSQTFATTWSGASSNASVIENQATSPANDLTADKLIPNTSSGVTHNITQSINVTSGLYYTFTCYMKAAEYYVGYIGLTGGGQGFGADFIGVVADLNAGTVTTATGTGTAQPFAYSIQNAGNGWYRLVLTALATSTTASAPRIYAVNGTGYADRTNAGNGTSGIYIWGAQLEVGSFATSYIPTTTAALTRNADVATMTGTNFSDWFNASEGTLLAEATGQSTYAQIGVGANTNSRIWVSPFTGQNFVYGDAAGTNQCALGSSSLAGLPGKICGGYKLNNFGCAISGGATATDLSGTVGATPDSLAIGYRNTTSPNAFLNGTIKKFMYWPQRLTNAELQAFSK